MRNKPGFFLLMILIISSTGCRKVLDIAAGYDKPHPPQVKDFATGLVAPLGIEADEKGQLWVTEAGTGLANDGQLSLITPDGKVYPVVKGFASGLSPESGIYGLNHLVLKDKTLWILHGVEGKLYKFDISSFRPGDAPLQASSLKYEDIGSFVKAYPFKDDTDESDIFNVAIGPKGDLFIADAGANAIIRRNSVTGKLSVFAIIPPIDNPSGDPAQVEPVPTGIVFDGHKFLVCTFMGFPFPAKRGTVYQVDLNGNASVYQTGFSNLVDIELGLDQKPVAVEYGGWTGQEFAENSGSILGVTPQKVTHLLAGLNFPNSIKRSGVSTYYVAFTFEGIIRKIVF